MVKEKIMSKALYNGLILQKVVFNKNFDAKTREDKLIDLCRVFGIHYYDKERGKTIEYVDPDVTYELTYDNIMKMLAIHMRFRSNIPVVIMGETGSGKTRMIRFMCDLIKGRNTNAKNMLILKTHGGITAENIIDRVEEAEQLARTNFEKGIKQTVLFFDEANTTSYIGTIKTIMCDNMVMGRSINTSHGLKFVAAVNPYRQHSEDMIKKLEEAGLGYHVRADKTNDKIGSIPMRRLVYRVKEIPLSMFPLIFDFGTLDTETEKKYIAQMVDHKLQKTDQWPPNSVELLNQVLSASQDFMRQQKDECSFVSLRDVER